MTDAHGVRQVPTTDDSGFAEFYKAATRILLDLITEIEPPKTVTDHGNDFKLLGEGMGSSDDRQLFLDRLSGFESLQEGHLDGPATSAAFVYLGQLLIDNASGHFLDQFTTE